MADLLTPRARVTWLPSDGVARHGTAEEVAPERGEVLVRLDGYDRAQWIAAADLLQERSEP